MTEDQLKGFSKRALISVVLKQTSKINMLEGVNRRLAKELGINVIQR